MIFYGTKGAHLKSEKTRGLKCNNCNEQTSHTISIFGKYFYVYWIPFFPLAKKGVSECNNCKATFERKDMSDQLKSIFDTVKSDTKTPFTYWIGSLIIVALIAFGVYSANQHQKDVGAYISSPEINDIIDYKSSGAIYSTLKVTKVTTDSVFVVANTMEIAKQSKLYKIDKEKNYTAERFGLSLTEYTKAFATNKFLDVGR